MTRLAALLAASSAMVLTVRAGSFDAQHAGDVDADGTATGCKAQAQGEKTGTPSTSACGAPGEARASQACPATGSASGS